jgi:hypothetical protein
MDTDALIARLGHAPMPARPLPRPWIRTAVWFAASCIWLAAVVAAMGLRADLAGADRLLLEQAAALATAVAAAFAAFSATIPGRDARLDWLPTIPLAVWLGSVAWDCLAALLRSGWGSLSFGPDWMCIPAIAVCGAVPAALIVLMLRRGAPLAPVRTMALAGLAAAGLGGFGLRLFHAEDASLMVLVWQIGTVFALSALSGSLGQRVLNWDRVTRPAGRAQPGGRSV